MEKKTIYNRPDENLNIFHELGTLYQSELDTNQEKLNPVLEQLLTKAIQECNEGKFITHEQVREKVEKRFGLSSNKDAIGFTADGSSITEDEYISDINEAILQYQQGTLETFSTAYVKKLILK